MSRDQNGAIGIVGGGARARTLARVLLKRGHTLWWADDPRDGAASGASDSPPAHQGALAPSATPERVAAECELVFLAVPAANLRGAVRVLSGGLDGSQVIVHAVRGLEPESLAAPSRVVTEESCIRKVGALLGPALADELASGPNAAVIASRFPEVIKKTQAALAGEGLRVYSSKDLQGVEAAGAAASIVAFALGICRELRLGATAESLLITRGIAEVARLTAALGGDAKSAFGLAGLGDVLVQRDAESACVRAGHRFARGEKAEALRSDEGAAEVFAAIAAFRALGSRHDVGARLTGAVYSIAYEGLSVPQGVERLMALSQLPE